MILHVLMNTSGSTELNFVTKTILLKPDVVIDLSESSRGKE